MHIKEDTYKRQRNILLTTPIHDNQLAKIIYAFNSTKFIIIKKMKTQQSFSTPSKVIKINKDKATRVNGTSGKIFQVKMETNAT